MGQVVTLGVTAAMSAFQLIETTANGASAGGIIGQGAIVGAGVAVFLFMDRKAAAEQKRNRAERRASDKAATEERRALLARNIELEAEVRSLHDQIFRLLTRDKEG